MNKWDVRRTEAAIKAAEAQIAGKSFNYESTLSQINSKEKQWNSWRADLYNKDIAAAKAAGKVREAANLQRDLQNFQTRLADERKAFESVQAKQSEYLDALKNVATQTAALSGKSVEEAIQTSAQAASSAVTSSVASNNPSVRAAVSSVQTNTASSAYQQAKAAREQARTAWNQQIQSGASKEALASAEAAWEAAKVAEIAAAENVRATTSAALEAAQAAASAASSVASEVANSALIKYVASLYVL